MLSKIILQKGEKWKEEGWTWKWERIKWKYNRVAGWLKFVENESDKKRNKKESESSVATGGEGDEGRAGQYGILHAIVHTQYFSSPLKIFVTT